MGKISSGGGVFVSNELGFRSTVFGGLNKKDVLNCIDKIVARTHEAEGCYKDAVKDINELCAEFTAFSDESTKKIKNLEELLFNANGRINQLESDNANLRKNLTDRDNSELSAHNQDEIERKSRELEEKHRQVDETIVKLGRMMVEARLNGEIISNDENNAAGTAANSSEEMIKAAEAIRLEANNFAEEVAKLSQSFAEAISPHKYSFNKHLPKH